MSHKHTLEQAYMTVSMARLLRDGETVFHGIASPIPMLAALFAQRTHAPNLTYLNISGSVNPRPTHLPHSTVDPRLLEMTSSLFPMSEAFDLAAKGRLDSVFLSGIQIDRHGHINMSAVGPFAKPKVRLPGGAGSAFLAENAGRVLLWRTKHDSRSFVNELSFCTATPIKEVYVVTPLCVFHREHSDLVVSSIHPYSSESEIRQNTGWEVIFSPSVETTPPLTEDDWRLLTKLDPEQAVAVEF
ncbi:MAG: CoA-transferase [Desulfitobacteriaceae bacterium]|nr:CoA-transferase [Desulfitobacteriaceae bacterium]MDI6879407.1 CoA-transferase [Desulfitobacteriaceae bacterium]MDI6914922.1 CoA-transferase [Desulfitobacteriaceae bacterium]